MWKRGSACASPVASPGTPETPPMVVKEASKSANGPLHSEDKPAGAYGGDDKTTHSL